MAWLAGVWGGVLLSIAAIGAPAVFAIAMSPMNGQIVGRMFSHEAATSLIVAMVMLIVLRRVASDAARAGHGSVISVDMLLVLGTLFCTLAGHYALLPMLEAARNGHGSLSFGELHAVSIGFYGMKMLLVLMLAWRLTSGARKLQAADDDV